MPQVSAAFLRSTPSSTGASGTLEKHGNPNVVTDDRGTSRLAQAPVAQTVLEASAPTYDLDDKLKKLIEKLAALDLRDAAFRCAEKVRKTLPGMLELYKKLANPN